MHSLGAALFQRRIVEERVRPRVQRLGRERRRRRQIARQHTHAAVLDAAQQLQPAVAVHRLVQAIVQRLRDQRVFGNLALADQILRTGDLVGEHRGQQIFQLHPLQRRGDLAPAAEARQGQRVGGIPAPAHAEQRRVQQRLHQQLQRRRRMQSARDLFQREAVPGRQRQHDRVLGGRRLQFEIEDAADALAQGRTPGAIDAAAVHAVDHQLGAAAGVEEALQHDASLRGQRAQRSACAVQIVQQLLHSGGVQRQFRVQPGQRLRCTALLQAPLQLRAQPRHAHRQFVAAPRRLA